VQRVKVALVEDHERTRVALQQSLWKFASRIDLVAAVPSAEAFFRSAAKFEVDVTLFDLGLPGMSGCAAIQALGQECPGVRSLALTTFHDEATVLDTMRAGACGYLLKDEPTERIVQAIEDTASGAHPLSSRIAGFIIEHARRRPPALVLTEREEELALALADGSSYADCASRMGIAIGTVQEYVKRVYRKLDVSSKRELKLWLARQNYPA
jgi:DNA-binding NarL/FixJ family response regulator